jgi:uncharacterized protein
VSGEQITLETARPIHRPVMLQGWYNLTSIHWRYDAAVVQRLLPSGFTVDEYDGSAWVGLLPFEMRRIRLPFGPNGGLGAGRFSSFPETNVRTYIVDKRGRRGVWFFSLDINRLAPTLVARGFYGLPYCTADMSIETVGDTVRYRSERSWPKRVDASCDLHVRIGSRIDVPPDSLAAFLSARWALGSTFARTLLWAEIEHPEWELHSAAVIRCDESLVAAAGLPSPVGESIALWSPGVEVRIGRPTLVARSLVARSLGA